MNVQTVNCQDPDAGRQFVTSLHETGFAILQNHPISRPLLESIYKAWQRFFDSDEKYDYLFDPENRDGTQAGFHPVTASETAVGYATKDIKEFFHVVPGSRMPLALQDEILHRDWTGWIINQVVKEDARFAAARTECEAEVYDMYLDVIREEKAWADYLFSKGPVIGLNAAILKDFVDYTAAQALREIGIKYQEPAPRISPIPWFNKHVDTHKKQTALQENESTNYVIGVMSEQLDYDALPQL